MTTIERIFLLNEINDNIISVEDEETINKMIATRIATRINNNIIQFDTQGNRLNYFDNCKEAGDYIGTRGSTISACCNGKSKTSMGFVWKYESIL